jgi:dTDP-4-dehydrorhamnose reductase
MSVKDIISEPGQFSHAVVLFGKTKPDDCARNRQQSDFLNITRTCQLIDEIQQLGIVPVFTSSEVVFDGARGNYGETDPVNPLLTYGRQKAEVDRFLQDRLASFLIVRLPRTFGSIPDDGTLFTSWLRQIERHEDIRCAGDHVFSPVHIDEAAEGMARLMERGCRGLFHIANPQASSRLEMLQHLVESWSVHRPYAGRLTACKLHDFPVEETRPLNVSMNSDKFTRETGIAIRPIRYWCESIVASWTQSATPGSR